MKIHVVCQDYQSNQILARLARILTKAKFTISDKPDDTAQLNSFFPYLTYNDFTGYDKTKTAAWFTHRDIGRAGKETRWNSTAKDMDLRLTSAELYKKELLDFGPTEIVTVPLDRNKFSLHQKDFRNKDRYTIGTSGFVYPQGRKGEKLFAKLSSDFSQHKFVASGQGWPVQTVNYDWSRMQDFYHSLDIYVCTSLIEGIGYGPLEALSCGIPVIIPRQVGVFDELPNCENLYRYEAGNYDSLKNALNRALEDLHYKGVNQESLRSATIRYSEDNWLNQHVKAFEKLLYSIPDEPIRLTDNCGVYYVAYGEPARECAEKAIKSFKRFMPHVPVALASDKPLGPEDIFIQNADEDIGARSVKTKIYELAPSEWDYVLYLDSDTEVTADISFLFQVLKDGFDCFFCYNPAQYALAVEMKRPDNAIEFEETMKLISGLDGSEILQLNGGVFGFRRNERTKEFFNNWHKEWLRYGARDQAALDRVLYNKPIKIYVLGNEFNTITRYIPAERSAGVVHYPMQARRWKGRIDGRLDSSEAWAAIHPTSLEKG
jgi:hypothetical protein